MSPPPQSQPPPVDEDLPPCCQREVEENRKHAGTVAVLRRNDRVAVAERRRKNLVTNLSWGDGCRCCYDPEGDGGEYGALHEERARILRERGDALDDHHTPTEPAPNNHGHDGRRSYDADSDSDSDSDDEFDYLLDEVVDSSAAAFEEQRRLEMEFTLMHVESARQHGYGVHRQLHPGRVLRTAGLGSSYGDASVVLHLYDPASVLSARMDLVLERLATVYQGSKFLRGSGRACLLMDKVGSTSLRVNPDKDVPCLIAVKDGQALNVAPLFAGLADRDEIVDDKAVEDWLDRSNVLLRDLPPYDTLCRVRPEEEALLQGNKQTFYVGSETSSRTSALRKAKLEEEEEDCYDCGLDGCRKTFVHKHVGGNISQEYDGHIVPIQDIL